LVLGLSLFIFGLGLFSLPERQTKPCFLDPEHPQDVSTAQQAPSSDPRPEGKTRRTIPNQAAAALSPNRIERGQIQPGQTATQLLCPYFSPQTIYALSRECKQVYPLTRLKAGQPYSIATLNGEFKNFCYQIDPKTKLVIQRQGQDFKVNKESIHYKVQRQLVSGRIDSCLYQTVSQVGERPEFALLLANIFAWDVDFVRDIRQGDHFVALVEKKFQHDEFKGYGRILAASFTNKGQTFKAVWFKDASGQGSYYTPQGQSVRKAFLKAPLSFSRISSGYSHSRLHPILKVRRPHHGIDYAAPTGTPVKSVGDGKVITRSYAKAAGRYIKIRHPNGYVTVYNHLSGFARGAGCGESVSQGQTIGYVGSTGLATGPHLDFRMKKNGRYINPLHVKSPPCKPVPAKEMKRFNKHIQPLLARLEEGHRQYLALHQTREKDHDGSKSNI
jgi:murein DD-endopeptidase MepM/ murein hydrolase activator NlpD